MARSLVHDKPSFTPPGHMHRPALQASRLLSNDKCVMLCATQGRSAPLRCRAQLVPMYVEASISSGRGLMSTSNRS